MKTLFTMKKSNILVTGPPGCGKSTLIEKVVDRVIDEYKNTLVISW